MERLLDHVDTGPAEETEAFVNAIYEQRRADVNGSRSKAGR